MILFFLIARTMRAIHFSLWNEECIIVTCVCVFFCVYDFEQECSDSRGHG